MIIALNNPSFEEKIIICKVIQWTSCFYVNDQQEIKGLENLMNSQKRHRQKIVQIKTNAVLTNSCCELSGKLFFSNVELTSDFWFEFDRKIIWWSACSHSLDAAELLRTRRFGILFVFNGTRCNHMWIRSDNNICITRWNTNSCHSQNTKYLLDSSKLLWQRGTCPLTNQIQR